jgi:exportin-2 (importin alpha re-exporter)
LIRAVCINNKANIEKFEANLFPTFNFVLQQDITGKNIIDFFISNNLNIFIIANKIFLEFIPYAFQLLSLMLELHDQTIPGVYYELFPFLLMPLLWERPGYIPALTRLLQAYIEKAASTIVVEKIVTLKIVI